MLELIRMFAEQFVNYQAGMFGFLASRFQQILLIQWCCSEVGATVAFHSNPFRESDDGDSEEAFCNWRDQKVLGRCTTHLCWARVLFG